MRLLASLIVLLALVSSISAEESATLKLTFRYLGVLGSQAPIKPKVDRQFCGQVVIPDERLIINPKNRGLKNVVVFVYTGRRGTALPKIKMEPKTHVLKTKHCRFDPHILIARKGDKVRVVHGDPVGHNANFQCFNNQQPSTTIPTGMPIEFPLDETEPTACAIRCNIHPWMNAWLFVLDHPFAAISDENGVLEIKGLPIGQKIVFRVFHESQKVNKVVVGGKTETWPNNRFERVLGPGVNDMGAIEIHAIRPSED